MQTALRLHAHGDFVCRGVRLCIGRFQHLFQARAKPGKVYLEYIEDLLGDTFAGIAKQAHHKMF